MFILQYFNQRFVYKREKKYLPYSIKMDVRKC